MYTRVLLVIQDLKFYSCEQTVQGLRYYKVSGHSSLDVIIDSHLAAAVVMILNCICGVCTCTTALNKEYQYD